MATNIATAFDQFKSKLLVTDSQQETIEARKAIVVGHLAAGFPASSDLPLSRSRLIGSAGRGTIIRPIADVDLMAVFENKNGVFEKYRHDSRLFLYRIRDVLNRHSRVEVVGARGQAVRFFYADGLHVDVAPVFTWSTGGYALPDGRGTWTTTDPDFHDQYFARRNTELSSNLKPLIRMLKRWNAEHSSYFKSFHLEVVTATTFASLGNNSREALWRFFQWAPPRLSAVDPAGHGGDLSSYLTPARHTNLVANLKSAEHRASLAIDAENAGNHAEAIRLWRIILGSEFPAFG